jgi:hypothetical protein
MPIVLVLPVLVVLVVVVVVVVVVMVVVVGVRVVIRRRKEILTQAVTPATTLTSTAVAMAWTFSVSTTMLWTRSPCSRWTPAQTCRCVRGRRRGREGVFYQRLGYQYLLVQVYQCIKVALI